MAKSGPLKERLHWAARVVIPIALGAAVSYSVVVSALFLGGLPGPVERLVGTLGDLIQKQVQR
jgi:hypothetical protein